MIPKSQFLKTDPKQFIFFDKINEIAKIVRADIGPHATPEKIQFTEGLPKTRSG